MSGADLDSAIKQWLDLDFDVRTRKEVLALVAANKMDELKAAMLSRISFGTAGLRAEMKAGFAYMNLLTVAQASQGLWSYLNSTFPDDLATRGIVVGYDGRWNSYDFAMRTAATFLSKGVKVYLFSEVVPTPWVSFGVVHLHACGGIMITASHNPAPDNGYKVYWAHGSQIISPHDKHIAARILENQTPWPIDVAALTNRLAGNPLLVDPTKQVTEAYFAAISKDWCFHKDANTESTVRFTFTPMHGVGAKWVNGAFEHFGLPPYFPVMKQLFVDPTFPTVAFPNPEEGEGALRLSFEAADRVGSPVVIACDPDADRLAAAEKGSDGKWRPFSGNEVGTLLSDWCLSQYRARHPEFPVDKLVLINTTVSSKMMQAIAKKEGCRYEECLTGFKWIGDVALRLEKEQGCKVILGFEQAIGYMIGNICPDKDGVRTAAVFAEMTNHLYSVQKTTLSDHLKALYVKYGYMASRDSYFFCYDPKVMFAIFAKIRNDGAYPTTMGKYEIVRIRDLMTPGYDNGCPDNRPTLPIGSSPMITFFFKNGAVFTLRGSGTEPKLKYYTELPGPQGEADDILSDMISVMVAAFLKPAENNLKPPN